MADQMNDRFAAIYENYLLRDLTYSAGGFIFLFTLLYAVNINILEAIDYVVQYVATIVGVLVLSYVLGLLMQEAVVLTRLFKTSPDIPKPFESRHVLMTRIRDDFGTMAIRELERTIYLKHFGSSIGSALVVSAFLILLKLGTSSTSQDLILLAIYVAGAGVCFAINRLKLRDQNSALRGFVLEMELGDLNAA